MTVVCLAALMLASCGLVDIDLDEEAEAVGTFSLDRDTLVIMVGDKYVFKPVFDPDTLANQQVFYKAAADTVIVMKGDTVVALAEGRDNVLATTVSSRLDDSCYVYVLPLWQSPGTVSPYETVVYADVTANGRAADDDMVVGAFCEDQLRCVGRIVEQHGKRFMLFRIGSEEDTQDGEDEEGFKVVAEKIVFRCYDRKHFSYTTSKTTVPFDGETHGKPSAPITLRF